MILHSKNDLIGLHEFLHEKNRLTNTYATSVECQMVEISFFAFELICNELPDFRANVQRVAEEKFSFVRKRLRTFGINFQGVSIKSKEKERRDVEKEQAKKIMEKKLSKAKIWDDKGNRTRDLTIRDKMNGIKSAVENKEERLRSVFNGNKVDLTIDLQFNVEAKEQSRRLNIHENKEKARSIVYMKNKDGVDFLHRQSERLGRANGRYERMTFLSSRVGTSNPSLSHRQTLMRWEELAEKDSQDQRMKIVEYLSDKLEQKFDVNDFVKAKPRVESAKFHQVRFSFVNDKRKDSMGDLRVKVVKKKTGGKRIKSAITLVNGSSKVSFASDNEDVRKCFMMKRPNSVKRKTKRISVRRRPLSASVKNLSRHTSNSTRTKEISSFKEGMRSLAFSVNSFTSKNLSQRKKGKRKDDFLARKRSSKNVSISYRKKKNIGFKHNWTKWQVGNIKRSKDRFDTERDYKKSIKDEKEKMDFFEKLFKRQ